MKGLIVRFKNRCNNVNKAPNTSFTPNFQHSLISWLSRFLPLSQNKEFYFPNSYGYNLVYTRLAVPVQSILKEKVYMRKYGEQLDDRLGPSQMRHLKQWYKQQAKAETEYQRERNSKQNTGASGGKPFKEPIVMQRLRHDCFSFDAGVNRRENMREGFTGHDGKNLARVHAEEMGGGGSGGAKAAETPAGGGGGAGERGGDDDGNGGDAEVGDGEPAMDSEKKKKEKKKKSKSDTQKEAEKEAGRKRKSGEGGGGSASSVKRRKGGGGDGDNAEPPFELPSESEHEETQFRRSGGDGAGGLSDVGGGEAGDGGEEGEDGDGSGVGAAGGVSVRDGSKVVKASGRRRRSAPFKAQDAARVYQEEQEEGRQSRQEMLGVFKEIASSMKKSGAGGRADPAGGAAVVAGTPVTFDQKNERVKALRQCWLDAKDAQKDGIISEKGVENAYKRYSNAQLDMYEDG